MKDQIKAALWAMTEAEAAGLDFLAKLANAREAMRKALEGGETT